MWHLWQQKSKNSCSVRMRVRAYREDIGIFTFQCLGFWFAFRYGYFCLRMFIDNDPSFCWKWPVVLLKVTCRFLENKHLLFRKQPDFCLCYCTRFTLGNGISSSSLWLISPLFGRLNTLNFKRRRQNNRKRQKFVYFCAKRFGRMEINFQLCSEGYELPSRALLTIST